MKKTLALILALVMVLGLAACGTAQTTTTPAATPSAAPASGTPAPTATPAPASDVTINVMLMPQGDMNDAIVQEVTDAVNARIAELGETFKVSFSFSGAAWAFDKLTTALQTGGSDLDIIPAHSWSGAITYPIGAASGQYVRLDDPNNDLLKQYGPDLYKNTSPAVVAAATVPGTDGTGIYGYIIEKDAAAQFGFLLNTTELTALGFKASDFNANDIASWAPLLKAYKDKYPDKYPLNVEGEVLPRTLNDIAYTTNQWGPLGIVFDNADPASTVPAIVNRYELPAYQSVIATMHEYYLAGYVDPDQGVDGDIAAASVANRRTAGDFLISTFAYAPGAENMVAASASLAQGKTVEISWAPSWSKPIATAESAMGSGFAVYSGSKHVVESVKFLNMLASDKVIGDLLAEGIKDKSYTLADGMITRTADRGGWNIWRYGVVGVTSAATPLSDFTIDEFTNMKSFNASAAVLKSAGFLFDTTSVDAQFSACIATDHRYAVALGSGAADSTQYDAFIAELKADGIDAILTEANNQLNAFLGG